MSQARTHGNEPHEVRRNPGDRNKLDGYESARSNASWIQAVAYRLETGTKHTMKERHASVRRAI